jgi:hypothetical protein
MAGICLGADQKVSGANCNELKNFLEHDLSGFPITTPPYCNVPGIELIRDQVTSVLNKMQVNLPLGDGSNQSLAKVLADSVDNKMAASANGRQILAKMGGFSINHAILQSLFTPHRQIALPTCNMDAIIVSETLNNPARLARIFRDILTKNAGELINLASNMHTNVIAICPLISRMPGGNPVIEVMPANPGNPDNQTYLLTQTSLWKLVGISPIQDHMDSIIGLRIPINDLNDALLANLMQNVYSGREGVVVTEGFVRSRQLYFGVNGDRGFLDRILCDSGEGVHYFSPEAMRTLVNQAKALLGKGITVASTMFSQPSEAVSPDNKHTGTTIGGTSFDLDKIHGHVENLYLRNIADILKMIPGDFLPIGDRNWCDGQGEQFYLTIVRETDDRFALTEAQVNRGASILRVEPNTSKRYGERGQLAIYQNT